MSLGENSPVIKTHINCAYNGPCNKDNEKEQEWRKKQITSKRFARSESHRDLRECPLSCCSLRCGDYFFCHRDSSRTLFGFGQLYIRLCQIEFNGSASQHPAPPLFEFGEGKRQVALRWGIIRTRYFQTPPHFASRDRDSPSSC